MRIGEVAASAGVNIQTVRFYERRGLLQEPPRLPSGYRVYQDQTPALIRFIKQAQSVGFTLNEIRELLQLRNGRVGNASQLRSIGEAKIRALDDEIQRLIEARDVLSQLLNACNCSDGGSECTVTIGRRERHL